MYEENQTKTAREHLEAMITLANTLITETINQSDPILPPVRTVSKADFIEHYQHHSDELCKILDNLTEQVSPNIDEELDCARKSLKESVERLQVKLDKLSNLQFWVDNMIFDRPTVETDI